MNALINAESERYMRGMALNRIRYGEILYINSMVQRNQHQFTQSH